MAKLHDAIAAHDLAAMREALSRGEDPDSTSENYPRFTALQAAVDALDEGGSVEAIELLLAAGADVNRWDGERDSTPLLMALLRNQRAAAALLLAAGADPNVRGAEGDVPLHLAVRQGDIDLVQQLLERGAAQSLNDWGPMPGRTPLGLAAERLDLPIVERLLAAGARVNQTDDSDKTSLDRARASESKDETRRAAVIALLEGATKR
jgi:ankyrin repeat protein